MPRVLLVDDERPFVKGLSATLAQEGFTVIPAHTGAEAWERLQADPPDIVLLDVMLPGADGLALCRRIRQVSSLPVIMLTARTGEGDKVTGLELGADDYITKPFSARELLARMRAVLRRAGPPARPEPALRVAGLTVDLALARAERNGSPLPLTRREFDLLAFLARHPGRVFSRDELLRRVWGYDYGDPRTVDVHVRKLREKLEPDPPAPALLPTAWGRGYYLDAGAGPGPDGPPGDTPL